MQFLRLLLSALILFLGVSCSDKPNSDPDPSTVEELYYFDTGDLNNDGIKDSVMFVWHMSGSSADLRIFIGGEDHQYTLVKESHFKDYCEENNKPHIENNVLRFDFIGYYFKYKNGDLHLFKYESNPEYDDVYSLDFEQQKIIILLEGITDSTIEYSCAIPQNKLPKSYSIDDCLTTEYIEKYIRYDLNKKIDSLALIFKKETIDKSTIVEDNDTMLSYSNVFKDNTFSLMIEKKHMNEKMWNTIQQAMIDFLLDSINIKTSQIEEAYKECRNVWIQELHQENVYSYYKEEHYSIEEKNAYNGFINYQISCSTGGNYRYMFSWDYYTITLDSISGEAFSWNMIKKEDELYELLLDGLKTNIKGSHELDESWIRL